MPSQPPRITSEQMRAARGLLRWSQHELATHSGVSVATIKRMEAETGPLGGYQMTANTLRRTFEDAGVEFIGENGGGVGVRFRERGL